ncbi:hypothetical protein AUEXF2481DRAFT_24595 [Aureobasidium subglaciale EXF-2481]|uniref:Uncharacterized protein n=1 Tax=Aureobasidium subglaciale (strain EXF-2481) TaxID=1043005 RepID=A0A074YR66_AURSE|nr:uncharacterized protein AUEXF2481DRAFT_24595 [Aureobasidium subglaciale EXF-2481]KER00249.1 hypothetical protein AUEXF2481DRAFT_24595 [Aureobasidium subglaciale EXF-2481]
MRASLSFLIALVLSSHVHARGLKPRQTSGATFISPSSAPGTNSSGERILHHTDVLHQHTHHIELPVPSLQLLDLFRASSLDLLHCPLPQYDFVKCPVLDFLFFQLRLLDLLFLEHPMLDLLVVYALLELFHKHSVLDFFLFSAVLELFFFNELVLEFLVIHSMPKLEDIAYLTRNDSSSHSIISALSLDDCNLGHQLHGLGGLSELDSLLRRLSEERHDLEHIQVVTASCNSCIGGSSSTWFYVTSTSSGPCLSASKTASMVVSSAKPTAPIIATVVTVDVSKPPRTSTQTVTSTQKVVKESSVLTIPIASAKTIATVVESAASPSRNMDFPSVSTVVVVSPSASMNIPSVGAVVVVPPPASVNTQTTVTIPISKILTTCPCTTPLVQPPASSPKSPDVPATLMASPPAAPTTVVSIPASSPVSPATPSSNSPPAQMSPPGQMPPPSTAPLGPPSSPVIMPPQNSSPPQNSVPPGNDMPPQGSAPPAAPASPAPPQSGPPEQPSSPPKTNSPPAVKTNTPPGTTPSVPATKPSMPPATDTNMSSGTVQSVKISVLTFMAPVAVAVAGMLL